MSNPVRSAFIYLMHLAWKSRLHIPFLLTVCFLVFDIRLQLEVNINMTRRRAQRLGIEGNDDNRGNHASNDVDFNVDDDEYYDGDDNGDDDDEDDDQDLDENNDSSGYDEFIVPSENYKISPRSINQKNNDPSATIEFSSILSKNLLLKNSGNTSRLTLPQSYKLNSNKIQFDREAIHELFFGDSRLKIGDTC